MSLFLDENAKEAKARKYVSGGEHGWGLRDETDGAEGRLSFDSYLAGWNECEKHVRESVSEGFEAWFCKRFPNFEAHLVFREPMNEMYTDAKASSLVEIEQLKTENERLKLHDIPGYQEGIEELKAQIKERDEVIEKKNNVIVSEERARQFYVDKCAQLEKRMVEVSRDYIRQLKERDEALIEIYESYHRVKIPLDFVNIGKVLHKHQSLINQIKGQP